LDGDLPFLVLLYGLRQRHDEVGGVLQRDQRLPSGSVIGSSNSRDQPFFVMWQSYRRRQDCFDW
jgi:hypothetical protein